jgi:hypothetical protein
LPIFRRFTSNDRVDYSNLQSTLTVEISLFRMNH